MSDKAKLVYVVTKSSWGGAQRYVYDLALSFKDDFDVEIWCGDNELGTPISLRDKAADAGIIARRIDGLGRDVKVSNEVRFWRSLNHMLRVRKPDILHLNSTKVGFLASIIGRVHKVDKIIYTTHGLANFEDRPVWQKKLISASNRAIFTAVDNVILISKMELEYTKNWYTSAKHSLIHNGIEPINEMPLSDIMSDLPANIKAKLGAETVNKFVGIGELHRNKGIEFALRAFQNLVESQNDFIYVHFGDGELKETLKAEVTRLGLSDHVYFFGFKENASAYLSHFDALVFSSIKEGLPYVIMEAGFAGIQTFASRVGGIPELISDGVNGYLHDPKDVKTLTKHLLNFDKKNDYNKNKIQLEAHRLFSISQMVAATSKIYLS